MDERLRKKLRAQWLYARALTREFRYSLALFGVLLAIGVPLFWATPSPEYPRPCLLSALYATLAILGLGEPFDFPAVWYLRIIYLTYPILGTAVVVQALVRFGVLLISKRNNEKEWMRVLASTYRKHTIVCGLGNVGFRVVERLLRYRIDVVAIEKNPDGHFVSAVKGMGVPVIIADVKEDASLIQAGIERARSIVIATNDDLANIEVALDARRMNPKIQVVLRMFDQDIARKIGEAFGFQRTFSASALAAPAVAALALEGRILGSCDVGDTTYITAEVEVQPGSDLIGKQVASFHRDYGAWIVAVKQGNTYHHFPQSTLVVGPKDVLVVQCSIQNLQRLNTIAGRPEE